MTTPARDAIVELYRQVGSMVEKYGMLALGECGGARRWPARGVYFFLDAEEPCEFAPSLGRIVRVGTHGLKPGASSTLWGRLRAHKGQADGSGNHRGSVFRRHVGRALLARDRADHPTWGVGSSADRKVRVAERELERRVSEYLANLYVTYVPILDEPGPGSLRGYVERNAISTLTAERNRWSRGSSGWLGRHSPTAAIEASGLWNVRHVGDQVDRGFLDRLDEMVTA